MSPNSFQSFFWAGFEATAALTTRSRLDQLSSTKHDLPDYCRTDYKRLKAIGIRTVRESMTWNTIDHGAGKYDFGRFETMLKIGKSEGIQQIWSLNHFDYPDNLDPFGSDFIARFTNYAVSAAKLIVAYQKLPVYINPINEITYLSWSGGKSGKWAPFKTDKEAELKKVFINASISAIQAFTRVNKAIKVLQIDPLTQKVPLDSTDAKYVQLAKDANIASFTALEALNNYCDIIGLNFYPQGEAFMSAATEKLDESENPMIPLADTRRVPLYDFLNMVYQKFQKPMVITETGAAYNNRASWWKYLISEITKTLNAHIPLLGVCAYPALDRADWNLPKKLTHSGLWDFRDDDPTLTRIPHRPTIGILKTAIERLKTSHA